MFSTLKRIAVISLIAGAFNAMMGVFLLIFIPETKFTFAQQFAIGAYIATTSVILIALGCALFGLSQDLTISTDATAAEVVKLKKRVDVLEQR